MLDFHHVKKNGGQECKRRKSQNAWCEDAPSTDDSVRWKLKAKKFLLLAHLILRYRRYFILAVAENANVIVFNLIIVSEKNRTLARLPVIWRSEDVLWYLRLHMSIQTTFVENFYNTTKSLEDYSICPWNLKLISFFFNYNSNLKNDITHIQTDFTMSPLSVLHHFSLFPMRFSTW